MNQAAEHPGDEQEQRRAAVHELRGDGLSERAIAEQLDLSQSTVHRIVAAGDSVAPERITGLDGRSRPAQRVPATTDGPGRDTEPVSTEVDFFSEALAAIPGYPAADAALAAAGEWVRDLGIPNTTPLDRRIVDLTAELLAAVPRPLVGELGSQALAAEQDVAARRKELELVTAARNDLRTHREQVLAEGVDAAFAYLHERLGELLERARPAVAALGTVRGPEDLMGAPDPTAARDALAVVREHAQRYAALREAQARLVSHGASLADSGRRIPWRELVAMVRQHGSVANPGQAGTPPADPTAALIWLLTADPAPEPWVPALNELLDRANPPEPEPEPAAPATVLMHHPVIGGI